MGDWTGALVHAYDPELIVVGGGVMQRAEEVLPALEAHVHRHTWTPWGQVTLRPAVREARQLCWAQSRCSARRRNDTGKII